MRFLPYIFLLLAVIAIRPVYAQGEGSITVIRDDGSVDVYDYGTGKSEERVMDVPPIDEPLIETKKPALTLPERMPSKSQPVVIKQADPAPVEKKQAAPVAKKPVKAVKTESAREKRIKMAAPFTPPLPTRKPGTVVEAAPEDGKKAAAKPKPEERPVISQNWAIAVAIDNAPPSKDYKVLKEYHEQKPVYAVVFKTDEGEYTVLVDAFTGYVVESGYTYKN